MDHLDAEDARMTLSQMTAACAPHWKAGDRAKEFTRLAELVNSVRWARERIVDAEEYALRPWRKFREWFKAQKFAGGVKFVEGEK